MDTSHDGLRLCGIVERIGGSICRWDSTTWDGAKFRGEPAACRITWRNHSLPSNFLPAIRWAWAQWAKVCAIEPIEVMSGWASINFEHGTIDGSGSTLAWANLPCGADPVRPNHLRTLYDQAETWHLDPNTPPQRGIHLGAVACHEIGHLLGLDHDSAPGSQSLLAPTYRASIRTPQQWDVQQAQLRYGPPVTPGTPSPTPTPGSGQPIRLVFGGVTYEGRVAPVA